MTAVSEPVYRSRASSLALRYALRELRGGLRGFYVFIACIALGVMAIAGVGSVAASLSEGLTREGRTLLGGDVSFSLIQREAKPEELAFLRESNYKLATNVPPVSKLNRRFFVHAHSKLHGTLFRNLTSRIFAKLRQSAATVAYETSGNSNVHSGDGGSDA